jgi:hypothetical protein
VSGIDCILSKDRLTIKLDSKGDPSAEKGEAMKKGDLFKKVFHLDLVVENKAAE